jgi:hypothetical protein
VPGFWKARRVASRRQARLHPGELCRLDQRVEERRELGGMTGCLNQCWTLCVPLRRAGGSPRIPPEPRLLAPAPIPGGIQTP